jgi:YfiH family protein
MGDLQLFEQDLGERYFAAFSTRVGGVSEGDFESLNLGILTDDEPDRVVENRRILARGVGAEPETATMAWQVHGARVFEADGRGIVKPGTDFEQGDGLWTETPSRALGLLTADCYAVVLARQNGTPRLVVLHVGWRGLVKGILEAGVEAADGQVTAAIGPGIGPCCYEVGEEVAAPFRERFGGDILRGWNLDLAEAIERGLRQAGVESITRTGHCTSCEPELFFSHRRDLGRTGRQGVVAFIH